MRKLTLVASLLAITAGSATAQVPVDSGVRFTFDRDLLNPSSKGVELVDVSTGMAMPLSMLSAAALQTNAAMLDPYDGTLIVGGIGFSADWVRRVTVNGMMGMDMMIVDLGPGWPVRAIDYDRDGHYYVLDRDYIYKVDRATMWMMPMMVPSITPVLVSTINIAVNPTSTFNAMCIDRDAHIAYVCLENSVGDPGAGISTIDLSKGTTVPVALVDFASLGLDPHLTGIAYAGGDTFYITTEDTAGGSVLVWDRNLGTVTSVPGAPLLKMNGVHYDRKSGLLHLVGAGKDGVAGDVDYYTLDPGTGALTKVTTSSMIGAPSDVIVNDLTDMTTCFPTMPDSAVDNTFELAAHGNTGELAGIAIVKVNGTTLSTPILIGVGVCDGSGIYSAAVTVLAGSFAPATTFEVQTGRIDSSTLSLVLGDVATVTVQ